MKLDELQREAEKLSPEEQRKLISFLVGMELQRNEEHRKRLTQRLDDQNPENWVSLDEAKRRLKRYEV